MLNIEKDSQKMIYYLFLFMIIMKLITGNGIDLKRIKTIQGVINHLKCYSYCQKFIHVWFIKYWNGKKISLQ